MKKIKIILTIIPLVFFLPKSKGQGSWHNLQHGLTCDLITSCTAYALCADTINNVLYAGGTFKYADSIHQRGIAKWDGTKWDSIPDHGFTDVFALVTYSGHLCVGDGYTNAVWLFDGTTWSNLPPFNGGITCLGVYKDTLYAAGDFTKSGTTSLNGIAKWDGSNWQPMRLGLSGYSVLVSAMAVYHDTLFVGGYFAMADTVPACSIAKWDGSHWSAVGDNGITFWTASGHRSPAYVNALETFEGNLYVAGSYDSAGGISAQNIATWNGYAWDTLNIPALYAASHIDAIKTFNDFLFMCSNGPIGFISKYDGSIFSMVDSGVNRGIYAFATWNSSLFAGGDFDSAGKTIQANAIARWTPDSTTTVANQSINTNKHLTIFPNPTSNQLTISSKLFSISELQIENVLGQTVLQSRYTPQLPEGGVQVDVSNLPQGIYFYRVIDSNLQTVSGKFIKE